MKKIVTSIMWFAVLAAAFVSCQKQEVVVDENNDKVVTELVFTSEKPAFVDETKTEWTGATIQWSRGDKISVAYTVKGKWQNASGDASGNAKLYKSEELEEAASIAQFNVSTYFTGTTEGTHIFYGVYPAPSDTDFSSAPVATLKVPSVQNPTASSFDPNGDLLIGVSDAYASRPANGGKISLAWNRLVAHAVITLQNISGLTAEESIKYITLTAQTDANLVGQQKVDLTTKEVVKDNSSANVLKLSADNLEVADGSVTFWACILPETITSLTVEVETDCATYTREISNVSLEFLKNARNTLAIKMESAIRNEKEGNSYVVDVLTRDVTGVTGSTYGVWTGKTLKSSAVYAGQSAGGNESIQLRTTNSNSGVVTTGSGGKAKLVTVDWHSATSNGRVLNVYGNSTAYTSPADLYDSSKRGTLLGTIECGTSTELEIEGDYEYIGMRSNSGAMYLSRIQISWEPYETE